MWMRRRRRRRRRRKKKKKVRWLGKRTLALVVRGWPKEIPQTLKKPNLQTDDGWKFPQTKDWLYRSCRSVFFFFECTFRVLCILPCPFFSHCNKTWIAYFECLVYETSTLWQTWSRPLGSFVYGCIGLIVQLYCILVYIFLNCAVK